MSNGYKKDLDYVLEASDGGKSWREFSPKDISRWIPVDPPAMKDPDKGVATSRREAFIERCLKRMDYDPIRTRVLLPSLISLSQKRGVRPWWAHPDFLIDNKVVVEVDYPADLNGTVGAYGHACGWPRVDLYRDDCYRSVGLTPVRIRMCGLDPVPGSFNILYDGDLFYKEIQDALFRCVFSALAGLPAYDYTYGVSKRVLF